MTFNVKRLFVLTKKEYFADFVITPSLTFILLLFSLSSFSWSWIPLFVLGIVFWTFYEYLFHRFLLHHMIGLYEIHMIHHRNQKEYVGIHPLITLSISVTFWTLFGIHSIPLMVGFSMGYIGYSILHTMCHYYIGYHSDWFFRLKMRHINHHRYYNKNFGVSVSWWDKLFDTEHRT